MKDKRGDVVLIDYPFGDASGSKVRPALVVQCDQRNGFLTETIVALITKNVRFVASDPTQLLIDIGTPDGRATALKVTSAAKCGKLFTVNEDLVIRRIGALSAILMKRVNECLKEALKLP